VPTRYHPLQALWCPKVPHLRVSIDVTHLWRYTAALRCGTMSHYRRLTEGPTYFFTVVSYRRRPIFCDEKVRAALGRAVRAVRESRPFTVDAWVLLPDHMHCIWTLHNGDHNYSSRWGEIKRLVSIACRSDFREPTLLTVSARKRRESTLWQRRFWEHQIRDENDFERHVDYIHFNPVKHRYVQRVCDWPHSTFHRYVREKIYPQDWGATQHIADSYWE
jgi:putative transposase